MPTLRFHTLDVFTQTPFGGNPLAVVLGGDALTRAQMQAIAREFNLSETVFVLAAEHAEAMLRLRIFTPFEELPFAGHPNIGAACLLAEKGMVPFGNSGNFVFEEGIGLVSARITSAPNQPIAAQITAPRLPQAGAAAPAISDIASVLGLAPSSIAVGAEGPTQMDCGLPSLLVPLRAPEHLAAIDPQYSLMSKLLAEASAHHVYVDRKSVV